MPRQASIAFYRRDSDPNTEQPSFHLKPSEAAVRAERGYVRWLSDTAVQETGGELKSGLEKVTGWQIAHWLQHSALNRGRCGQFTIGYPIPYAFEGHLRDPRAAIINFAPNVTRTNP